MESCRIKLELEGTWCNDWPRLRVTANNNIYWDAMVQGDTTVEFAMPVNASNLVRIEHHGKHFGEQGRWDTESHNDSIVRDRAVKIKRIWLDQVDLTAHIMQRWPMHTAQGPIYTDYLGHNGYIDVEFGAPVYSWIITQLIAPKEQNKPVFDLVVETSFGNLFNYDRDKIELGEIQKILDRYAHLLDKPTQVRNPSPAS